MREIKFRAWVGGRFRYWGFIRFPAHARQVSFVGMPTDSSEILTLEELQERSQQYTGLKDKNGREIYEGDILAIDGRSAPIGSYYNIGDVRFGGFGREADCRGDYFSSIGFYVFRIAEIYGKKIEFTDSLSEVYEELEVIGNIYENPELLANTEDK